jgi:hypothetical protein
MAKEKKSIIEEALLEAKSLEDALKANTKEILASTMREEINSVVRESLSEQDEEIENDELEGLDDEMEDGLPVELGTGEDSEMEDEMETPEMELGDKDGEMDIELDLDLSDDEGGMEMDLGDDESELSMELGDEEGMMGDLEGLDDLGGGDEMDLTMSDDEEVLKVFKKLSDDDEIEVVKDEGGISLKDNQTGAEYYIKESEEDEICEGCGSDGMYGMEEGNLDEVMYEVELDADMADELEASTDEDEELMGEDNTLARSKGRQTKGGHRKYRKYRQTSESRKSRKPLVRESRNRKVTTKRKVTENTVNKVSYQKLLKEYKILKGRNTEYKEALKVFKTKINEVALFNQNLAHVTKLFTEHSTTKKEKMKILGRFDNVETVKESKTLYKSIEGELSSKTPINESIDKKVNKTIDSSKSNLNESSAYVDPSVSKIKDLMKRMK